jgi:membrane dipeptidase
MKNTDATPDAGSASEGTVLSRRSALKICAAAGGLYLAAPMINCGRFQAFAQAGATYSARAIDLVEGSLVIDMLSVLGGERWEKMWDSADAIGESDFQWLKSSGVGAFHAAINPFGSRAREQAFKEFGRLNSLILYKSAHAVRIGSAGDFERVKREGKAGFLLGAQNSVHFENVDDVDAFWLLGQRVSQLTHNDGNRIGSGGMAWFDRGLTEFGAAVVERMNKTGMTIDVAHCADRTTLEAIEASSKPVAISHANCRALNPGYPRCKTDEALRKMAAKGGVMGLTVLRAFVRGEDPTTIEHWLDHVDYVAKLVGVEHVGIGSDAGFGTGSPEQQMKQMKWYEGLPSNIKKFYRFRTRFGIDGLDHPKRVYDIAEGLIRRGYSDADIRGVLGLNFKRMLEETWSRTALRGNPPSTHVEPNANPTRSSSLYTAADASP